VGGFVSGSGRFVELEAVAATAVGLEAGRLKVEQLRRALGSTRTACSSRRGYAARLGA
jgi:hypothetical protein